MMGSQFNRNGTPAMTTGNHRMKLDDLRSHRWLGVVENATS
jgi:hypothetical protein